MKKVCGYKDSRGEFHDTEQECELAESRLKLEDIIRKMDISYDGIYRDIKSLYCNHGPEDYIAKVMSKYMYNEAELLLEIVQRKEELKTAYAKELANIERLKSTKRWWLNLFK